MSFRIKELSIRDFNNNLNSSIDLEDNYNRWKDHREYIKKLIDSAIFNKPNATEVIVFGAGECNDLDLNYLGNKFNKVVLTDVDKRSIDSGISRQNLDDNILKKIQIREVEYTGLDSVGFFEGSFELIKNRSLESKIDLFIEESLEKIKDINLLDEYKNKFQIVLSAPVYSQLLYTQANVLFDTFNYFDFYKKGQINKFKKKIYKNMPKIMKKYNDLLISVANEGAYIVSWTDMYEGKTNSNEMIDIKDLIKKQDHKSIEDYIVNKGMKLSLMGISDYQDRVSKVNSNYWIWPFDNKKEYLVYGLVGEIKKGGNAFE